MCLARGHMQIMVLSLIMIILFTVVLLSAVKWFRTDDNAIIDLFSDHTPVTPRSNNPTPFRTNNLLPAGSNQLGYQRNVMEEEESVLKRIQQELISMNDAYYFISPEDTRYSTVVDFLLNHGAVYSAEVGHFVGSWTFDARDGINIRLLYLFLETSSQNFKLCAGNNCVMSQRIIKLDASQSLDLTDNKSTIRYLDIGIN